MANIVVAFINHMQGLGKIYPYYRTFLDGLRESGNNVLCFDISSSTDSRIFTENVIPEVWLEKIRLFNPDLFIIFNNQFWDMSKYFEAPIIIYDVDSPKTFPNKQQLMKNDRYRYLTIQRSNVQLIRDMMECLELRVEYIPPFTGVTADDTVKPDINIAFCGAPFANTDFNQIRNFLLSEPDYHDRQAAKAVYDEFIKHPFYPADELYDRLNLNANKRINFGDKIVSFSTRISGIKRMRCLTAVADLGLEIRGLNWLNPHALTIAFPELLFAYSSKPVSDLATTAEFYNRAKIGINVNHIQAQSGFSWRVADIMASNACLVAEKADDFAYLGFDVPCFTSPSEARDWCQRLLQNDDMRTDLVAKNHEIIDKNHRFINVLPVIEEMSGMSLHKSDAAGTLEIVRIESPAPPKPIDRTKEMQHIDKQLSFLCNELIAESKNINSAVKTAIAQESGIKKVVYETFASSFQESRLHLVFDHLWYFRWLKWRFWLCKCLSWGQRRDKYRAKYKAVRDMIRKAKIYVSDLWRN